MLCPTREPNLTSTITDFQTKTISTLGEVTRLQHAIRQANMATAKCIREYCQDPPCTKMQQLNKT
eukprot:3939852-Amphidinium_carterae.1